MNVVHCQNGHENSSGMRFCTSCGCGLPQTAVARPIAKPLVLHENGCCSSCGMRLSQGEHVCSACQTIVPFANGHQVDPSVFQWAMDGQAMAKLRSISPLVSLAKTVSQRVGRPWIESTFNGIRLGYRQMPQVYTMAVQAARILGLNRMPNIYVSGERPWNMLTFGSDDDAFIVIGSAMVSCFRRAELMFLFARELGHILAGHTLWKTVIQILVGEQSAGAGMMKHGIAGLLDPGKWIEGAIELPLIGWARQAEITADRAGLLASGGLDQVRRILMMWSLKSPGLYQQINIKAWLDQQEQDSQDNSIRLAELVTSATPYLSRRLRLLQEYDASLVVHQFRQAIVRMVRTNQSQPLRAAAQRSLATTATDQRVPGLSASTGSAGSDPESAPGIVVAASELVDSTQNHCHPATTIAPTPKANPSVEPGKAATVPVVCPKCQTRVLVPGDSVIGKPAFAVRCTNEACSHVIVMRKKSDNSIAARQERAEILTADTL